MKKILGIVVALLFVVNAGVFAAESAAGVIKLLRAQEMKMQGDFKDMTFVVEAKMQVEGMDMQNTTTVIIKGNKKRVEVSTMGMTNIMVADGKDIWMVNGQTGKKKLNSESEAGENPSPFSWVDNINEKDVKATEETAEGRKCFVLYGTDKKNNKARWFIDKPSLVLLKYEGVNAGKDVLLKNSDFKTFKGYELPYKMEYQSNGKTIMTGVVKSVEVNKGVNDVIFNVDSIRQEELGKMDMQKMMEMMQKKK